MKRVRGFSKITLWIIGIGLLGIVGGGIYWKGKIDQLNGTDQDERKDINKQLAKEPDELNWDANTPDIMSLARSENPADREQALELQKKYDAVLAGILARNPGLRPTWKSVPDEQNGFLQCLILSEAYYDKELGEASLKIPEKAAHIIHQVNDWDADIVTSYVNEQEELLQQLTSIGLLPEQSTHKVQVYRWVDYGYSHIVFMKSCVDLLCADARLAAEKGDADRALLRLRAAMGISRHHTLVESPTLLLETLAILTDSTVLEAALKYAVPVLKLESKDLIVWRQALTPPSAKDIPRVLRGEFWGGTRGLIIPVVEANPECIDGISQKDINLLYDARAQAFLTAIRNASSTSALDIYQGKSLNWGSRPKTLPSELDEVYQTIVGFDSPGIYFSGLVRAKVIHRYYDAAFAIAAGKAPPVELITGKPFKYDPSTRRLTFPNDPVLEGGVVDEPITLP